MSEKVKSLPYEAFWFKRRAFLEKAGYQLRPKFNPHFVAPTRSKLGDDHTAQHPVRNIVCTINYFISFFISGNISWTRSGFTTVNRSC
jgi:hypothetical protein